ncbi:MAG: PEP/pyruvate-binding domain-containing protein [Nitrospiraceae bacterium]
MARPLILPLSQCTELDLVGGKAFGLARLIVAGFPVPSGICLTTEAYCQSLNTLGFSQEQEWQKAWALSGKEREALLAGCQARIRRMNHSGLAARWRTALQSLDPPPSGRWAVRSSATNEDTGQASFAGLYRTRLGVALTQIDDAIKDLWASLWQERVVQYMTRQGRTQAVPAMAVVIQPMLDAQVSGVAYSIHPVTGRSFHVVVNAVPGLAEPLVDGRVAPDQYVVEIGADRQPVRVRRQIIAPKPQRLAVTEEGLRMEPIPEAMRLQPSLSDQQLFELGRRAKEIEQALGHPVDLEWAIDTLKLWVLQARPITGIQPSSELTNDDCEWSRTNFKETMPELPSPLGLSFLEHFMDAYIIAPYRRLGCRIPDGLSSTRVLHGRPYLNVTLFHSLVAQLRGDPSLLSEQMGGEPITVAPLVQPLGWLALVRAGILMLLEMRRATVNGPKWFAEMKGLAKRYDRPQVETMSLEEVAARLDGLGAWIHTHELTFSIAGGVAQCLQVLNKVLPRWLGPGWRPLLNGALQGQGRVISAQQILRLAEVADIGRHEPAAVAFLSSEPWNPSGFRASLKDTAFLRAFEAYMGEYGHRGLGESDIMSPRLADNPEAILFILRSQVASTSPGREAILSRQEQARTAALNEIKHRMGWRAHHWAMFLWWYRRLCRFFALREANRHHLMHYSAAARNLLLRLGELLVARSVCDTRDDVFFLTIEDRAKLLSGNERNWRALIRERRRERERHAEMEVPDTIRDWEVVSQGSVPPDRPDGSGPLAGIPISVGSVTGPVRLVRSLTDWGKVIPGDIIVAPVIDPGMAPLFGIAGGLIVEMGGTLSHGAIIAREYGLPTVANVEGAMSRLREGQLVRLDAGAGSIRFQSDA